MTASPDFSAITELAGDPASREQIERLHRRYYWAGNYVRDRDVLELGCGAGQGLGYFASIAKSVVGSDISEAVLEGTRRHYAGRIVLAQFGAEEILYPDSSFDCVVFFEAVYYVRNVRRFLREARRVLRPGGYLLIATANKDLFDFTPSPHSVDYYGVRELGDMLAESQFDVRFFGDTPISAVSAWQRVLRPVKLLVTSAGIMPKSKRMKAIAKRIVFGPISQLPAEIGASREMGPPPAPLKPGVADTAHKVIFCEARRR